MSRPELIVAVGGTAIACCIGGILLSALDGPAMQASGTHAAAWVDIGKSALGTLFGSVVAFGSFLLQRQYQHRRDNIVAGNLALFKLRSIQKATLQLRYLVRYEIAMKVSQFSDAPDWILVRPMVFSLQGDYSFDMVKLAFLLDSPDGRDAMKTVKYAEVLFGDLLTAFEQQQKCAIEMQDESVHVAKTNRNAEWSEIADHLGPAAVGRLESLFRALLQRVEQNPTLHEQTFDRLRRDLGRRFGDQVWDLDFPRSSDPVEGLAQLPGRLKVWLETLPT